MRHVPSILIAVALGGAVSTCRSAPPEPAGSAAPTPSREDPLFVYVRIPAPIEPLERGERFEDPLDAALRKADFGQVTGGGTALSKPDAQGRQGIEYCGIDVDLYDPAKGIPFLREELARLQAPRGTVLQYELAGQSHEVPVYDESAQPR